MQPYFEAANSLVTESAASRYENHATYAPFFVEFMDRHMNP